MNSNILTDELRRFIQSIDSIPHLEAMLIPRQGEDHVWDENIIAKRLYLSSECAARMRSDLCVTGICTAATNESGFIYAPTLVQSTYL